MAMNKTPGPSKPADLLRKPAAPVSKKTAGKTGAPAKSGSAQASDSGDCTCGAEIGKQLESMGAPAPGVDRSKAEKDYQ